jgi:hypothetical protein
MTMTSECFKRFSEDEDFKCLFGTAAIKTCDSQIAKALQAHSLSTMFEFNG